MDHKKTDAPDPEDGSLAKSPISVEEAEKIIAAFPVTVHAETVPLPAAQNRVLSRDIFSPIPVPEFDKSAMDGYAYISEDHSPAYQIIETIAAGTPPRHGVAPGQCAKIMTGAMLPSGADRVVKRECTRVENGLMKIISEDKNRNIRFRGEDIQPGLLIMEKGTLLNAAQVALLASLGLAEVPAARQPRVSIITTGSELIEPGNPLGPGQIYNSNYYSLAAQVSACGAMPLAMGRLADDLQATAALITGHLPRCDVLIISGGVSAGDFDFVPEAMRRAGITLLVHKIAVQPGMPTVLGASDGKIIIGLPGNPVSTFVIFEVFIKPLLMRMMGNQFQPLILRTILESAFRRSQAARSAFLPLRVHNGRATVIVYHGSAHLHALSQANALLYIPAGQSEIPAGSAIDARCL